MTSDKKIKIGKAGSTTGPAPRSRRGSTRTRAAACSPHRDDTSAIGWRIPAIWNCWGYDGPRCRDGAEILVDQAAYVFLCLQWIQQNAELAPTTPGRSLSQILGIRKAPKGKVREGNAVRPAGDWIRRQILYAQMIRTTTAWDHDGDGRLSSQRFSELGTFLKATCLLPYLKRMGMSAIYLLPVVKVSQLFRKGALGSPYASQDFFELDPALGDRLLEGTDCDLATQFRMFVDCAHRLGMRVIIDIAPRTAARDNEWIIEHPEWFYWIDARVAGSYQAPKLPRVNYGNPIASRLHDLYDEPHVRAHLTQFRFAPSFTHPLKWSNFVRQAKARRPDNLLAEIVRHFGVITPPAFSDVMNDPQPPWSDVTYLRLYLDHPAAALKYLKDPAQQPPYVLFDTIKSSLFPGRRPNRELWRRLARILPFYQQFGVDGARVDMAHALPRELEEMVLTGPRKRDPDFCLLAEDLGTTNHAKVRAAGYNLIVGSCWHAQPRMSEGLMHPMLKELPHLKVPVTAAAELPDTPRAAVRKGGRQFSRQAVVIDHFLPNAVPMINSGLEVFERQPMNLGLDNGPPDRYALPGNDPQYGRLAFFDPYALHWLNPGARQMIELIGKAARLRHEYMEVLTRPRAYFAPRVHLNARSILSVGFRLSRKGGCLLLIANTSFRQSKRTTLSGFVPVGDSPRVLLETRTSPPPQFRRGRLTLTIPPGDAKLVLV